MDDSNQKISVAPISYLKIFFRRKELFLIPAFAGLILGICAGILLPKKYRSSTIILVEEGKTDNPLFNNLAVSTTVNQRMSTIRESILGWDNLVKLVKRLSLDKNVKSISEYENLIMKIRDNITIKLRAQNIIDLSYVDRDPKQTRAVVETVTNIFVERNMAIQNQETSDAIAFIQEQLKLYAGKIKSAEIAQLQDQLNTLLIDSTDQHPRVKELKEQIAKKRAELEKQNLPYTENASLDSTTTNPIIEEIKRALENMEAEKDKDKNVLGQQKDIYKVMLIDKLDDVLARDVGVNTQIYNMLLQRLETAKITQRLQSSKEGTRYTILDPPRIPLKPFIPNKPLVTILGLFLGVMLGVGLVVGKEFFDKSFLDVEEAKNYLGMPLLGAISRINTIESIKQEREKTRWLISFTLASGIITVILAIVLSSFLP